MNILENLGMAAKTLTANKLRSILTMLGIIIGNSSVIAVFAIGEGAKQFTQQKLESIGPNQISVWAKPGETEGLSTEESGIILDDVEAIANQAPAVVQVAPQISGNLQVSYRDRNIKTSITGTSIGILFVRHLKVKQGRFFDINEQKQNVQVVTLGATISRKLFGSVNPLGKEIQINNKSFQVIGIMESKGAFLNVNYDEAIYIPITTVAEQLVPRRSPRGIVIDYVELSAKDKNSVRAAAFQIINILTRRHGKNDFTVSANKSIQDLVSQVTNGLSIVLGLIASISLLVGGIGIMNIMLVSVTERTKEIGLRKAIGATESEIMTQFLIEAIILSVEGGLIGTGIGISGTLLVAIFSPLQPSVPIGAIIIAAGVSGGIGLIFGVTPAHHAAKLDPITALRSS
jgi:putative ABC transport system permease protein